MNSNVFDAIDDIVTTQTVEEFLNTVIYGEFEGYVPSAFALEFINFIKLVNGAEGEENESPVVHLKMLDQVPGKEDMLNMCARGMAKTTLLAEYLFLYIAVYGTLPDFGKVNLALYVSDSIDNGVKNMRKNLEFRYDNSEFLKTYIPNAKFTDTRWEFTNADGSVFIVKGYGAKALSLDSVLHTTTGTTTIGECNVGDKIFGADGNLTTITKKSEVFHKPMYQLELMDGRSIKVSEDHINPVVVNTNPNNTARWEELNLTTEELLQQPLVHTKKGNLNHRGTSSKSLVYVKNVQPLQYAEKALAIDPYTLGVILGDGRIQNPSGSVELTSHINDVATYHKNIPYEFGKGRIDKRNNNVWTQSIRRLGPDLRQMGLCVHGSKKFIPEEYFRGSVRQRLELLKGLMDTDGTVTKTGRTSFCSMSPKLLDGVAALVRSLGGTASGNKKKHNIEIWLNMELFKLERKLQRQRFDRKADKVAVRAITEIAQEPSQCIAVDNEERQFITGEYVRTHNTGVRGAKELGVRPQLAVLDDLVSDEDAKSPTVIANIEDTIYKAIDYALHPKKRKIIWSGTPFNAKDPLYKAVESGAWRVNVYPICENFPCTREEFKGAWEDRFDYDYVMKLYMKALKSGKINTFNQELMLRIMSDEERLIQDSEIKWYPRQLLLRNRSAFNFYITTDFATSEKSAADFSVISVWAINANGDWFWVDGVVAKQDMGANVDDLFRLCQAYRPLSVGIEIAGQQGGFIPWIKREMITRNVFFHLASENNEGKEGMRPNTNKIVRFNVVQPWFKAGKMHFPEELKTDPRMVEAVNELSLITAAKIKSKHDDFLDTISMLASINAWRPAQGAMGAEEDTEEEYFQPWEQEERDELSLNRLDSYT